MARSENPKKCLTWGGASAIIVGSITQEGQYVLLVTNVAGVGSLHRRHLTRQPDL